MTNESTNTPEAVSTSNSTKVGLPLVAMACMISMLAGMLIQYKMLSMSSAAPKVAIVGKNEVILRAMLDVPALSNSPEKMQQYLIDPINKFQADLASKGFVVLEATKDEHGGYAVNAVPPNFTDETEKLSAAVKNSLANLTNAGAK